jgi:aminopeptidase YwaD
MGFIRYLFFLFCFVWQANAQVLKLLQSDVAALTDASMKGRGYVEEGENRAAHYIEKRFYSFHLQNFQQTYRQNFQIPINIFDGKCRLSVENQVLQPGVDFIPDPASKGIFFQSTLFQLDTSAWKYDWYKDTVLSQLKFKRAWAIDQKIFRPFIAWLEDVNADLLHNLVLIECVHAPLVFGQSTYQKEYVHLKVINQYIRKKTQPITIQLKANYNPSYPTQNVYGFLEGTSKRDSFIVFSAHYDHLGKLEKVWYPGANDNASGVALLLQLADSLSKVKPTYSVLFIAFGAEEAGLLGSNYFVEHPLIPLQKIKMVYNIDIAGGADESITFSYDPRFTEKVQKCTQHLARIHPEIKILQKGSRPNSDHFPFQEKDVPSVFIYTTGKSKAYHHPGDRAENLSLYGIESIHKALLSTTF